MKWYPWLRPPFEQLVASYQAGRGHHALMVYADSVDDAEAAMVAIRTRPFSCATKYRMLVIEELT